MATAIIKILLIGEHSVVHGTSALSIPVDITTTVEAERAEKTSIHSHEDISHEDEQKLREQTYVILTALKKEKDAVRITIQLGVPPGIGFGISASVAVALIRSLFELYDQELPEWQLFELAAKCEEVNHGNPSGIDHITIVIENPILFQNGEYAVQSQENNHEILKDCYLINTGTPQESTKEMVEFVADRYEQDARATKILFQKIQVMVPIVASALRRGDADVFRDILNEAGEVLETLGVVSTGAQKLSKEIRKNGGMAKISGAGGRTEGSGLLFVWHAKKEYIQNICEKYGYTYWRCLANNSS